MMMRLLSLDFACSMMLNVFSSTPIEIGLISIVVDPRLCCRTFSDFVWFLPPIVIEIESKFKKTDWKFASQFLFVCLDDFRFLFVSFGSFVR